MRTAADIATIRAQAESLDTGSLRVRITTINYAEADGKLNAEDAKIMRDVVLSVLKERHNG